MLLACIFLIIPRVKTMEHIKKAAAIMSYIDFLLTLYDGVVSKGVSICQ